METHWNKQNRVNHIRSLRIGWLGHIIRLTKKLYKWKSIGSRTFGRPSKLCVTSLTLGWLGHVIRTDYQRLTKIVTKVETMK